MEGEEVDRASLLSSACLFLAPQGHLFATVDEIFHRVLMSSQATYRLSGNQGRIYSKMIKL
eukprot:640124-Amphidinium_carterae.1